MAPTVLGISSRSSLACVTGGGGTAGDTYSQNVVWCTDCTTQHQSKRRLYLMLTLALRSMASSGAVRQPHRVACRRSGPAVASGMVLWRSNIRERGGDHSVVTAQGRSRDQRKCRTGLLILHSGRCDGVGCRRFPKEPSQDRTRHPWPGTLDDRERMNNAHVDRTKQVVARYTEDARRVASGISLD